MDGLRCTRDRVSEILVRMMRREADFVFRAHGTRSYSLYAEDRSADMLKTMVTEKKLNLHHHDDGAVSAWVFFDITEVTR
jgi:hypothetical protein